MANLRNRQDEYDDTNIQKPDHPDLYVINPVTGTGLPKFWRSVCSWRYGATHYVINHEPTPGYKDRCDTCLHHLREERQTLALHGTVF